MIFTGLSYREKRDLAVNSEFLQTLAVAVADAAITVYTEDPATAGHTTRASYATQVVKNPDSEASLMAWTVVLLAADDADATLKATVLNIWNAFAGVA